MALQLLNSRCMRITSALLAATLAVCVTDAAAQSQAGPTTPTAFANLQLPEWLRMGVEHRGRLEGPMGAGFTEDRDDLYWLNRFRVTARFRITPWLSAA